MKKFLCAVAISVSGLTSHSALADSSPAFTAEQEIIIKDLVSDFSSAMGRATIDPVHNCPGLQEQLRSKLVEAQPLVAIATSLSTDEFSDSSLASDLLDTELALKYVKDACAAVVS